MNEILRLTKIKEINRIEIFKYLDFLIGERLHYVNEEENYIFFNTPQLIYKESFTSRNFQKCEIYVNNKKIIFEKDFYSVDGKEKKYSDEINLFSNYTENEIFNLLVKTGTIYSFPEELIDFVIKNFNVFTPSPYNKTNYGGSYYSLFGKDWGYEPAGIIRISDHWNFTGRDGKINCPLNENIGSYEGWIVAKWNTEKNIFETIQKFNFDRKKTEKTKQRSFLQKEKENIEKKQTEFKEKIQERLKKNAKKQLIGKTVIVEKNVFKKSGGRFYFAGTEKIKGVITKFTKDGKFPYINDKLIKTWISIKDENGNDLEI